MSNVEAQDTRRGLALAPRRTLFARIARRDEPSFVTARAARNLPLMRLLAIAMVPDDDLARAGVERAERSLRSWRETHGDLALDDQQLRDLLARCVADALDRAPTTALTSGLSAGLDSRPLVQTLWDLGYEPELYCCGQPGNIDWDVVSWLRDKTQFRVTMINSTEIEFSLDEYEHKRRTIHNYPLDAIGRANDVMSAQFPGRINVHGFLNDVLTGDNREKAGAVENDARVSFAALNDEFRLQQLMEPTFVDRILPSAAVSTERSLDLYRQYDIGYRQYSRIRPLDTDEQVHIFPFEDSRWVGYWLSRPRSERAGQSRWYSFVQSLNSALFADLDGLTETGRKLRWARKRRFYGHNGKPGIVDRSAFTVVAPREPGSPFDLYACALNNQSFRTVIETSLARVRGRRVFRESFLDTVETRFWAGDVTASKMLNGVVTADIALESGRFDR